MQTIQVFNTFFKENKKLPWEITGKAVGRVS